MSRYDDYPNHPLHGVPEEVLKAGRSATREAIITNDIEPTHADAIADAVIMAALPKLTEWLASRH